MIILVASLSFNFAYSFFKLSYSFDFCSIYRCDLFGGPALCTVMSLFVCVIPIMIRRQLVELEPVLGSAMTSKLLFSTIEVSRQVFYRTSLSYAIVNLKPIVPGREQLPLEFYLLLICSLECQMYSSSQRDLSLAF